MQNIKTKEVIKYATLPRVVPRVKSLFSSGFGYIPFLLAHVYFMVRLLPQNHPYLLSENVGRFGLRHLLVEVSRNLKFSRNNIDQILIFFVTIVGIFMFFAQLILVVYATIISPAMAFSWFVTYTARDDIAFNLLDQVFGVPGIYCTFTLPAVPLIGGFLPAGLGCTDYMVTNGVISAATRLPFHVALHELFRFYSIGLLLIAVLIFLYFMVVIIVETAVSGTPFGQRFQNVWVPVRLVVALGLLMPISFGLNSGQWIVLYTAKWGSGLATNGWFAFNTQIVVSSVFSLAGGFNPVGERYSLLAFPEVPDITSTIETMGLVHACAYSYHRLNSGQPNVTRGTGNYLERSANYTAGGQGAFQIQPYLVKQPSSGMTAGAIGSSPIVGNPAERVHIPSLTGITYMDALGFYYASDIIVRFGEYRVSSGGVERYPSEIAGVKPLCGDVRIPVVDVSDAGGAAGGLSRGGPDAMLRFYYELVLTLWFDELRLRQYSRLSVERAIAKDALISNTFCNGAETFGGAGSLSGTGSGFPGLPTTVADCNRFGPNEDFKVGRGATDGIVTIYQDLLADAARDAWGDYVQNSLFANVGIDVMSRGWGGAGIWYNKLAEMNGGWMDGVRSIPVFDLYPTVMEQVRDYKEQHNASVDVLRQFDPTIRAESENSAPKKVRLERPGDELESVAEPLAQVYAYWNPKAGQKNSDDINRVPTDNVFTNAMHLLLGTDGLTSIRGANLHLHPMAQLVAVGKGLVNAAVRNMAGSTTSAFLGGMLKGLNGFENIDGIGEAASHVFFSMAFLGLTAGFVLFYVLPFLPFLYFYFAVASWVKAIFEAMVGVPLWALAHMRIDGEGLPGDAAQNGYFLIMEIFVRPILTVFGLVASVIIFSTQVRILNLIWDLVTVNASGYTPGFDVIGTNLVADLSLSRSVIDQFFFTVVYTMICYMLALSSFKLIDKIPDNILRWAGAGVSSFGDIDQDQVESLNRYAAVGGMTVGSQAAGAIRGAGQGLGGALNTAIKE